MSEPDRPPHLSESVLDLRLRATDRAPRTARARVAALDLDLGTADLQQMELLVSELVTNSVRHAHLTRDSWLRLTIEVGDDQVVVAVHDEGPGFTAPAEPAARDDGVSGYGLVLVDRLSSSWSVERNGSGTTVWFALGRDRAVRRRQVGA